MSQVVIYGIPNCDTIKKARRWLAEHDIAHDFHDYRKAGLERDKLQAMVSQLGWEAMLNRRGTTWRALPEETRENLDRERAIQIMLDNPAIIKRPILAHGDSLHLGFSPAQYHELFD